MVILNSRLAEEAPDIGKRVAVRHRRAWPIGCVLLVCVATTLVCRSSRRVLELEPVCENGSASWQRVGFVKAGSDTWVRISEFHQEGSSGEVTGQNHSLELVLRLSDHSSDVSQEAMGYAVWGAGHHIILDLGDVRLNERGGNGGLHLEGTVTVHERSGASVSPVLCRESCRVVLGRVAIEEDPAFACGIWSHGYAKFSPAVARLEPPSCVGKEDLWQRDFEGL